jgi:hypothetical protein
VTVTSLFEGRWLRVMTVGVQVSALAMLTGLVFGIQWTPALMSAARRGDPASLGGVAWWPPSWFVGVYQHLFGAAQGTAVFDALAPRGFAAVAASLAIGIPLTLWLWRRGLRELVSAADEPASGRVWSAARRIPVWLTRRSQERAYLQFFLAVLWRSARHRLALLTAMGLAGALTLEGALVLAARTGSTRWLTEFAVPVLGLLCLLAILRWLLLLPAELPASWVLGMATPAPGRIVRRAVGRVLLLLAVGPSTLIAFLLSWSQGDIPSAAAHALLVAAFGLALVEYAVAKVNFLPFATEYLPGRSNLKARWPIHAAVLLVVVPALAGIERVLVVTRGAALYVTLALIAAGAGVAMLRRRRRVDLLTADPGPGEEWTPVQLRIGWV